MTSALQTGGKAVAGGWRATYRNKPQLQLQQLEFKIYDCVTFILINMTQNRLTSLTFKQVFKSDFRKGCTVLITVLVMLRITLNNLADFQYNV
jgi:hypothetical protein